MPEEEEEKKKKKKKKRIYRTCDVFPINTHLLHPPARPMQTLGLSIHTTLPRHVQLYSSTPPPNTKWRVNRIYFCHGKFLPKIRTDLGHGRSGRLS
jgi:hypothetical protein